MPPENIKKPACIERDRLNNIFEALQKNIYKICKCFY